MSSYSLRTALLLIFLLCFMLLYAQDCGAAESPGAEESYLLSLAGGGADKLSESEKKALLSRFIDCYGNLLKQSQPDRAFGIISKASELFPWEKIILVNLSGSYAMKREYEKCVEIALRVVEDSHPQVSGDDVVSLVALAHNNAANAYLKMGDTAKAKEHLEKSLKLQPDLSGSNYLMGEILSEQGDYEKSLICFSKAFSSMEKAANPEDFSLYALALGKTQRLKDATAIMEKGVSRFPLTPGMHLNLASMLCAEKRYAEALYELHIELLLFKDTDRFYRAEVANFLKLAIDEVMKDKNGADYEEVSLFLKISREFTPEKIEEIIKKSRTKPFLLQVYLAESYVQKGDLEKAKPVFERVIAAAPYFVPAYVELGEVYQGLNDRKNADNLFKQAILMMPDNWKVRMLLKERPDLTPLE